MSLVKFNRSRFPDWNSFFDGFFDDDRFTPSFNPSTVTPATNIEEKEDAFVISMAVPGLKKEDFDVIIDNNILTISSQQESTTEDNEKNYSRKEYSFSSFKRSFTLPKNVKDDQISASYENGELVLTLPKSTTTKSSSKVIDVA